MAHFYLLMGPDEELDLARAELWAVAGCTPQGRVAVGAMGADVTRAAYIRLCGEQVATGSDWPELQEAVGQLELQLEGYRIEVFRPGPKAAVSATELKKAIADLISGRPNLDYPRTELAVVVTHDGWHFGPIISRSAQRWRAGVRRPYHYSHALAPRMARALVNLVAAPGDLLLDPCCGSGTVVAEALADGIHAWGMEISPALAHQAAANLRALRLSPNIFVGDACTIAGSFDAAVVDLPYGHSAPVAPGLHTDILLNLRSQVRRMAVVVGADERRLLRQLGFCIHQEVQVVKGRLTRHIYVVTDGQGE